MKKLFFLLVTFVVLCSSATLVVAEEPPAQKYEYAIVKWDGPDRLFFNLPDRFELKFLSREGVTVPREAQAEEFCLAWAANKMAKDNWTPISFDSRRILFRRLKG